MSGARCPGCGHKPHLAGMCRRDSLAAIGEAAVAAHHSSYRYFTCSAVNAVRLVGAMDRDKEALAVLIAAHVAAWPDPQADR